MERDTDRAVREPGHSPDFVKVALIVFLAVLAVILVTRFVVGVKLNVLGL
jgi:hypothetical protein